MKKLLFILSLSALFACSSTRKFTQTTHQKQTDSVFVTKLRVDTILKTLPDSSSIMALVKCQENGKAIVQMLQSNTGKRINTIIKMKHDTILLQSRIDSAKIYFSYFQNNKYRLQTKTTDTNKEKVIVKYRIPSWVWLVGISVILFLLIKFVLPYIKVGR